MQQLRGSSIEALLVALEIAQPVPSPRVPVGLLSREQKAAQLRRVQAEKAMLAGYEAELILGLAADTPELPEDHRAAGTGSWAPDSELPGVAESFTHELSMVLNCGRRSASIWAHRAWTFRESLPGTWAALAAGALDEPRAISTSRHATTWCQYCGVSAACTAAKDFPRGHPHGGRRGRSGHRCGARPLLAGRLPREVSG